MYKENEGCLLGKKYVGLNWLWFVFYENREHVLLGTCIKINSGQWIIYKSHAQINLRKIKPQKCITGLNQTNTKLQTQPRVMKNTN